MYFIRLYSNQYSQEYNIYVAVVDNWYNNSSILDTMYLFAKGLYNLHMHLYHAVHIQRL